jgi:hypothetical protein
MRLGLGLRLELGLSLATYMYVSVRIYFHSVVMGGILAGILGFQKIIKTHRKSLLENPYLTFSLDYNILQTKKSIYLGGQGGYFKKLSYGSETSDMTFRGLGRCLEVTLQRSVAENFH